MSEDKPVEIFFYQLMSKPLEKALPQLLERSVERGWNVVLQTRTQEKCVALNELLWT